MSLLGSLAARSSVGCFFRKRAFFTGIQKLLSVDAAEKLNQLSDETRPSGLVAGYALRLERMIGPGFFLCLLPKVIDSCVSPPQTAQDCHHDRH